MTAGCEERWILHSWGEPMTLVPYLRAKCTVRPKGPKPLVRLRWPFLGIYVAIALSGPGLAGEPSLLPSLPPNIVYILADDLGLGDVRCFNPDGKITTPHLDRLAAAGMRFTDAHSSSAVCTPTRYGILTGRYNWRSSLKSGVLYGYSPRLIEPGRLTVPEFLRQHGYRTACVGKWHLGMDWPIKAGDLSGKIVTGWEVDYAGPIANGPMAVGFDDYFGISASLDMPPFVFIERDHPVGIPTVEKTWVRKGPAGADFEAVDVLPALVPLGDFVHRQERRGGTGRQAVFSVPSAVSASHADLAHTGVA